MIGAWEHVAFAMVFGRIDTPSQLRVPHAIITFHDTRCCSPSALHVMNLAR